MQQFTCKRRPIRSWRDQ